MVGQVSTMLADAGLNISDLLNKSRGDVAYTLIDVDGELPEAVLDKIRGIAGILRARVLCRGPVRPGHRAPPPRAVVCSAGGRAARADDAEGQELLARGTDLDLGAQLRADAAVVARGPPAVVDLGL